jgi:hypothetical protein
MKHGKKPTREQRKFIERSKLSASEWLVERETSTEMVLVHRFTKTTKTIWK